MIPIDERIEALGGSRFVREYQPVWEAELRDSGFRLGNGRLPVFMTVDETPRSAERLAHTHLPYLTGALHKALARSMADPVSRIRIMESLQNAQVVRLLDVGRLPRGDDLMGRYDTFLQRHGDQLVPRVIEANFNNVEGSLFQHLAIRGVRALADELGLPPLPASPTPLEQLWHWMLSRYRAYRTAPAAPTIGITWDQGNIVKDIELPAAADWFRRWGNPMGINVVTGDVHELERGSHGWALSGRPIDLLWKNTGPLYPAGLDQLPFAELPRTDPEELVVLSDIVGRLLGSKWLLGVLWNPAAQGLFSPRELAAIHMLVPWTAELRDGPSHRPDGSVLPDMLSWVSQNRNDLVLKPSIGSHGDGVVVGPATTQADWDAAVNNAAPRGSIVMAYVAPEEMELPIADPGDDWHMSWVTELVDCNFYMYGNRVGPPLRRAASGPILNVAKDTTDGRPGGGLLISLPEGTG
ncbi:MAG: hypothetical protein HKN94_06515 [Acidimicrobiales bacterium]|nr:hypothetical protein [Acidimicrobiales bacterium]RZV43969.1 MAG: hypothetical protein EX269_12445 [Acidimicrobiales bacterium]